MSRRRAGSVSALLDHPTRVLLVRLVETGVVVGAEEALAALDQLLLDNAEQRRLLEQTGSWLAQVRAALGEG